MLSTRSTLKERSTTNKASNNNNSNHMNINANMNNMTSKSDRNEPLILKTKFLAKKRKMNGNAKTDVINKTTDSSAMSAVLKTSESGSSTATAAAATASTATTTANSTSEEQSSRPLTTGKRIKKQPKENVPNLNLQSLALGTDAAADQPIKAGKGALHPSKHAGNDMRATLHLSSADAATATATATATDGTTSTAVAVAAAGRTGKDSTARNKRKRRTLMGKIIKPTDAAASATATNESSSNNSAKSARAGAGVSADAPAAGLDAVLEDGGARTTRKILPTAAGQQTHMKGVFGNASPPPAPAARSLSQMDSVFGKGTATTKAPPSRKANAMSGVMDHIATATATSASTAFTAAAGEERPKTGKYRTNKSANVVNLTPAKVQPQTARTYRANLTTESQPDMNECYRASRASARDPNARSAELPNTIKTNVKVSQATASKSSVDLSWN